MDLYGRISSSNVQAVRWCMAEFGLTCTRHDVGGKFGGLDTTDYLNLNPNGKIPTLTDGDVVIFESSAILRYLATRHATAPFWPDDHGARAQVDKWAEWAKRSVADLFTGPIFWRVVRTPAERHDHAAIRAALDEFERELAIAEAQLEQHSFLAGDAFTLADIVFGHVLYRYFDIDITRRPFPHIARYYQKLTQRPAYAQTVMINYDDLRNTF